MSLSQRMVSLFLPLSLLVVVIIAGGCYQGQPSTREPLHLNPNMDWQPKVEAQEASGFFADSSGTRYPVPGTVARGELYAEKAYYTGIDPEGDTVAHSPVPLTMELVERGRDRYNIYCSPCHGRAGDGKGIIATREGMAPPASFHDPRLLAAKDGHFFNVVSNGLRNMQSYRHQIPVHDRWAIIAYVRALQLSQNAPEKDVPADKLAK
jgi:Cytochrome C oxidase, cbb3-type, subunit III